MYKKIIFNQIDFENTIVKISKPAKALLERLLDKNPLTRINIEETLKHSFFSDFNFNHMLNFKVKPPIIPDTNKLEEYIDPLLKNKNPGSYEEENLSPVNIKSNIIFSLKIEFEEFTYCDSFLKK